ncbi:MAG: acyltransferase [Proteobacteria bacterium]|nr:acyltransferase [Pseudomonadota bacterium]
MRYLALDSWRGICALFVALYHLPLLGYMKGFEFFQGGFLFVDFFFVLSGFVMTEAYGKRLQKWTDLKVFIVRRFGRVWPLHISVLLIYFLVEVARFLFIHFAAYSAKSATSFSGNRSLESFFGNAFMVHSFGLFDGLTWNSPSWSISAEFWVYLCFAALVMLARTRLALVAFFVASFAFYILMQVTPDSIDTSFQFGFIRCAAGFFAGVFVCKVRSIFANKNLPLASFLELLTMIMIYFFVSYCHQGSLSLLSPLVFSVAVFIFSFENGGFAKILNRGIFPKLAIWSYSIYMVHEFVIIMMNSLISVGQKILLRNFNGLFNELNQVFAQKIYLDIASILVISVIVLLASVSYRFIEKPGQEFFNRLIKS